MGMSPNLRWIALGLIFLLVEPSLTEKPGLWGRDDDALPPGAIIRLGTDRFRHPDWHKTVALAPDGRTAVSTAERNSLRFWDPATGKLRGEIETDDTIFTAVSFSPNSKHLVSVGAIKETDPFPSRGALRIFDVATQQELRTIKIDKGGASILAFTPDGKTLVTNAPGGVSIWEFETGIELLRYKLNERGIRTLAVSPDGKLIAAAGEDGFIYLWEWESDKEPRKIKASDRGLIGLAFSPDGRTLAGSSDGGDDGVRLWDVATGRAVRRLTGHEGTAYVPGLAFSPDGKVLATTDPGNRIVRNWSGGVLLWDPATGKLLRELPTPGEGTSAVSFSADGRWLAAGTESGLHVWNARTWEEVGAGDLGNPGHRGHIGRVAVSGQGLLATASDDHTVRLWDLATGKQRMKLTHSHWVRGVALSPDGSRLAASALGDTVHLWDTATGRSIYKLAGHGGGGRRALGFLPDGKGLLSFGDDFYLRHWDMKTGKAVYEHAIRPSGIKVPGEDTELAEIEERMMRFGPAEMAFSPDGKMLVLDVHLNFHVFETGTGKERRLIPNEGGHVVSVAISPDSKLLLASAWSKGVQTRLPDGRVHFSAARDHPVCVYDLATGGVLRRMVFPEGGAGPVAFSPDGKMFAVALAKPYHEIRLCDVATGEELHTFGGFRGRVSSLTFSADMARLITAMDDTTVLVWGLSGGAKQR